MRTHFLSFLDVYLHPKIIAVLFLGFASGLPLALTLSTLSVWLTEEGVSRTAIGLFAAIGTPYALKYLWSPLIDQMPLPFITKMLGRRRGWMIFIQGLLILSIVGLGSSDPAMNAGITALWALCVAIASASQDTVIDAYRVEVLEEHQQGAGAAVVVFGYRIGMLVSGAGALFLASYTTWFWTYAIMAACVLIGTVTVLINGEPKGTPKQPERNKGEPLGARLLHWLQHAVIDPFKEFIQRSSYWWVILLFVVLYKFGDAFAGVMTNPFLIETGFSKVEIASIVKTYGLLATLVGALIGGAMVSKVGLLRSLWLCGLLQMGSNLMFVWQAQVGYDTWLLSAVISIENLSGGMGTAAFVAYISALCNKEFTATQYALLSSLAATGRTWLSASSGFVVDYIGWTQFFIVSTAVAIPGLILLVILQKKELHH